MREKEIRSLLQQREELQKNADWYIDGFQINMNDKVRSKTLIDAIQVFTKMLHTVSRLEVEELKYGTFAETKKIKMIKNHLPWLVGGLYLYIELVYSE